MRKLAPHGTESAYSRHIRHKETPCQPCRDASMAAQRARRADTEEEIRYDGEWVRDGLIWRQGRGGVMTDCKCQIVGWSRDPYEPHIPAQAEWEQADDCPVHPR